MYNEFSRLSLFDSSNSKQETIQKWGDFRSSFRKLRAFVVAISKNLEMFPHEHKEIFNQLMTMTDSEAEIKLFYFGEKIDQAFELSDIGNFLDEEEISGLKELFILLYSNALERQEEGNVVALFKQSIQDVISEIQNLSKGLTR